MFKEYRLKFTDKNGHSTETPSIKDIEIAGKLCQAAKDNSNIKIIELQEREILPWITINIENNDDKTTNTD